MRKIASNRSQISKTGEYKRMEAPPTRDRYVGKIGWSDRGYRDPSVGVERLLRRSGRRKEIAPRRSSARGGASSREWWELLVDGLPREIGRASWREGVGGWGG